MKIYISTDLEGISGVVMFEQTREKTSPHYQEARHLLMADIAAVVEGCRDAGADEVVVMDGHGGGFNFIPSEMHPGATYVTGIQRPRGGLGVDETFGGVILLGFHAMNGTETGVLHHTQSSKSESKYWYGGRECGEIFQSAVSYSRHGLPVVMVTGDDACCAEAAEFLGEQVVTVSVKEGYSRQCAKLIAPKRAHEMLRAGAAQAVHNARNCKPFKAEFPMSVKLQVATKEIADKMKFNKAKRVDDVTFEGTIDGPEEVLRF